MKITGFVHSRKRTYVFTAKHTFVIRKRKRWYPRAGWKFIGRFWISWGPQLPRGRWSIRVGRVSYDSITKLAQNETSLGDA